MLYPKVYLQIPHYNNAQYLRACIESCQKLNYPNLDIHLFNDSSEDNTKEVLKSISTDRINIHHNPRRLGRVDNYQNCFSYHGDAEWFVNLDSDDYYTKNHWIDEAIQIVEENSNDSIVHIQSNFLNEHILSDINPIKQYENDFILISGRDYVELCIKYYNFSHLGSIFNVERVRQNGAYIDDCMHTDFLTAARVAVQGNVLVGMHEIGQWRKHDGNQSDTRYSEEEYKKNELAYYKFFEWTEDYIPYKNCKSLLEVFEKRQFDKKVNLYVQSGRIKDFSNLIRSEKDGFTKFFHSLITIYFSSQLENIEKLKNISIGISTRILSVIITLVSVPFIIHFLGIENYGWIGIYTTIASAMYIFDFGLTSLITKEIAQHDINNTPKIRQVIGSQELMYHMIGVLILSILYLGSHWIAEFWIVNDNFSLDERVDIIRLICLAIYVQWPHSFYSGVLFGLQKQTTANISQLILTFIKNVGAILILHFIEASIYYFFIWQISISILTVLVQKYYINKAIGVWNTISYFSLKYSKHIKNLALSFSIITVFGFIYSDLNNFILSKWLNLKQFGYYNILFNVVIAMIMYCATVKNALFPYISKIVQSKDKAKEQSDFLKYGELISYSLIPISIFLSTFSYDVIMLWFNNKTIANALYPSLPWITLGSLANALMIIPWTFLIAKEKTKFLVITSGLLALISIPILYLLVQNFGLKGASIYWFVINFVPLLAIQFYFDILYHEIKWRKWKEHILKPIAYASIYFLGVKLGLELISATSPINTVIILISLVLCYMLIICNRALKLRNKI